MTEVDLSDRMLFQDCREAIHAQNCSIFTNGNLSIGIATQYIDVLSAHELTVKIPTKNMNFSRTKCANR